MSNQRIVGASTAWAEALDHVSQLAPIDRAALIIGERGTGKELIAERLHFLSPRWEQPLVKVNCAAFSDNLLESELFGHEAGAFTGATGRQIGRFERADQGTLFLDELGTLPKRAQEKILRIIEYGEFERLGSAETQTVNVRIVAATNADLPAMVERGLFRGDLLDRLSFDVINLPPLRDRQSDILELSAYFAVKMSHELGWELFPGFSAQANTALLNCSWPGNVRELKNVVERSVYRWGDQNSAIEQVIINPFKPLRPSPEDPQDSPESQTLDPHKQLKTTADSENRAQAFNAQNFNEAIAAYEKELLNQALKACKHHQGASAKYMGLSYHQFRGLYRKHLP